MAFFDIDEYGLGRPRNLFDYATILEEEEEEKRRSNKPMIPYTGADLSQYSPTQFDVPDIASALTSTAPTGINPAAPAESQPPAIDVPVTVQEKYERMEGVTNSDRLAALGMSMSAIGTTDFNRIYGASNAALIKKQREADEYNMQLDEGTTPKTEIKGSYLVTYEPMYIRNADSTYSINPKAGQIRHKERSNPSFEDMGANEKNYDMYERMIAKGKWKPKYEDRAKDYRYWGETYLRSGGVSDANRNSLARNLEEVSGLSTEDAEMASYWNRDGVIQYGDDNGTYFAYNPLTKERVTFRSEDEASAFRNRLEQDKADIQTMANVTADQVPKLMDDIRTWDAEYVELDQSLDDIYYWYNEFDQMTDEDYKNVGGWYNNFMYQVFGITDENAMLAGYDQAQIRTAIDGLNDVNVAPVSNFEFGEFKKLLGSNKIQDRRALVKLLKKAVERKSRDLGQKGNQINDNIYLLKGFDNGRFGRMYDGMGILSVEETLERFGT